MKEGGDQIEYADEDPRVSDIFKDELAKEGLTLCSEELQAFPYRRQAWFLAREKRFAEPLGLIYVEDDDEHTG